MIRAKKLLTPHSMAVVGRRLFSQTTRRFPPFVPYHCFSTSCIHNPTFFSTTAATHFIEFPRNSFCTESGGEADGRCWNCNAEPQTIPFLFCNACRTIQPVDSSVDYFQIFGLEKKYELEVGSLEGKYKDWQKKLHPDLVHSKSQKERECAAEQSARVIDAYRTLGDPLSRAIYMLKLEGVNVNEEETLSEPDLLTEIMETREAVEEAPDSQALNEIKTAMQDKLQQWAKSFANALHSQKYDEAITCIQRMTYYDRVNEEIVKRL